MMPRAHTNIVGRAGERGQTMILVVFSMLALLAMAAIAIDVTTLYVARHEAQQAADAAALAGAKTFVTSGFTSGYVTATTAQTLASNAAQTAGQQLSISGSPITSSEITVVPDTSDQLNPYVSVTIARTSLQTYFARIWGVSTTGVRAKATAEAYNPSGQNAPIQLSAVKPFLLPNCKPNQLANTNNCTGANVYFIDPTTGSLANSGSFIGQPIRLQLPSNGQAGNGLAYPTGAYAAAISSGMFSFFPIDIPIGPPTPLCPSSSLTSCSLVGNGPYFDNIACSNPTQLSCGQTVGGTSTIPVDTRVASGTNWSQLQSRVDQGSQCLIHATSSTSSSPLSACSPGLYEQDCFKLPSTSNNPILISPGINNPDPSLSGATYISRSDSVVTVPLFDGSNLCEGANNSNQACNYTAEIVGFLQIGITRDMPGGTATIEGVILNASGCNPNASSPAVTGSTLSSIPVRLIQAP